jgi:hypothetical protein
MSQNLFVFVLMPFDRDLEDIYLLGIKSAVEGAGMTAQRVDDQVFHEEGILERIYDQIEKDDLIVAYLNKLNTNVFYEVGYAHAKRKPSILLTNSVENIPFDLRNRRHIVYSSIRDLKEKLLKDLYVVKGETELSFDPNIPGCLDQQVSVNRIEQKVVGQSQATSIRVMVKTNTTVAQKDVTAFIEKIEKYTVSGSWDEAILPQSIQLTWADTDTNVTDLSNSVAKFINVLHIDHIDNKITIWRASMLPQLIDFFNDAATYRFTVSIMAQGEIRHAGIEIDWKGQWDAIKVRSV